MLPVLPLWIPVAAAIAGLVAFTRSGSRDRDHDVSDARDDSSPRPDARAPRAARAPGTSDAPVPSALEVFNAFLRDGRPPPREIAELAASEARAAGIADLAADIEHTFLQGLPSHAGPSGDTRVAQTSSAPLGAPLAAPLGPKVSVGRSVPSDAALIGLPSGAGGESAPAPGGGGLPPDLMAAITGSHARTAPAPAAFPAAFPATPPATGDSPIPGLSAEQWGALCTVLAREPSSYDSQRHIGRYRQSKQRLAELGIDLASIARNPDAQDRALEVDLADAYKHLAAGRVLDRAVGRPIVLPDVDEAPIVTLPGILGVCAAAGLDHCASWLRSKSDRTRFRHTTNLFLRCNAVGLES